MKINQAVLRNVIDVKKSNINYMLDLIIIIMLHNDNY